MALKHRLQVEVQKFVLGHPEVAGWMMSRVSPDAWERRGRKRAMEVYWRSVEKVPAYRIFLEKRCGRLPDVGDMSDFWGLPIMDRGNYDEAFPLSARCQGGSLRGMYVLETSSGHSGEVRLWPRTPEEDKLFPYYIEYAFRQFYGVDKQSTLAMTTLALGTWTSGEKMAEALRRLGERYDTVTAVSPGTDVEGAVEILRQTADRGLFEQRVIVGYPPFLENLLDVAVDRGLPVGEMNIKLGLGGEGYSEEWRDRMKRRLGVEDGDLLAVAGGYGAADIGMTVGREYPVTVAIRKEAERNPDLARDLFGTDTVLPSLVQYNPGSVYVEGVGGELIFTALSGAPRVRYKIYDEGGVLRYDEVCRRAEAHGVNIEEVVADYGYAPEDVWKMPMFFVLGRTDGTVCVSGANVYVQNFQGAVAAFGEQGLPKVKRFLVSQGKEGIVVHLELADLVNVDRKMEERYREALHEFLGRQNMEYADATRANPNLIPEVELHCLGDRLFSADDRRIKQRYVEGGAC